jgi:hypothetical protein
VCGTVVIIFVAIREEPTVTCIQAAVVDSLRRRFGDIALFFWNAAKGDLLGIVWKPKAFLAHSFSILDCRNVLPIASTGSVAATAAANTSDGGAKSDCVVMNITKIISDMVAASDGVIADIIIR